MKYYKITIILIILFISLLLVNNYLFSVISIKGTSMNPTLIDSELLLIDKIAKKDGYKRFQIVAINIDNKHIVKRIIGLPGEKIVYENGVLYINDVIVNDPYSDDLKVTGVYSILGNDEYFVMGDNRNVSEDSRNMLIGNIKENDIMGIATYIIYPFNQYRRISLD